MFKKSHFACEDKSLLKSSENCWDDEIESHIVKQLEEKVRNLKRKIEKNSAIMAEKNQQIKRLERSEAYLELML